MLIHVFSKLANRQNIRDRKIKTKLNLALYFFFYFDPTSFHQSKKGFQLEKKVKNSLRKNLNLVKRLFSRLFLNLQFNSKQNKEEDLLLLKHYLKNVENLKKTQSRTLDIKSGDLTKLITEPEKSFFLLELSLLDDFLNV